MSIVSAAHWHAARRFLVAGTVLATACGGEPKLPPIESAAHLSEWNAWKAKRVAFLSTPGRPMSYTALTWIAEGPTTIGGDSSNTVRLVGRDVPPKLGTLIRTGTTVRFEPMVGVTATIDSQPAAATALRTDAVPNPSIVSAGTAGFRIVQRVDSMGVRAWDADKVTPEAIAKQIAPLEYFELNPAWRIAGRLVEREKPETLAVATSAGVAEVHIIVGMVAASVGGQPVNLTAYAGANPTDLFFTFSDESSGEDTYGFRFLHAALDPKTNIVTLDFNFAYNPDCAFSAYTTCPLPPDENRIGVRIPAGERAVRYLADESNGARAKALADKVRGSKP